ncbi:hypothetical protein RHMOL_Rhmol07G0235400 [Rhododendron molle]|uniref:Uncharacterized protein n=1 Tax=Rhododendron molle TaxID=49168 RepID=A0ACC0N3W5_RHOML|nr:hypothetical protein RHMOL_Rhmol07G0235400 [Rhododendron molle]
MVHLEFKESIVFLKTKQLSGQKSLNLSKQEWPSGCLQTRMDAYTQWMISFLD